MRHRPDLQWRPTLLAAGLVLTTACVPLPGHRYIAKEFVARKEGENTLVAANGATCRVKADTYEKVQVGDEHACAWQYPDDTRPAADATTDPRPRRAPGLPGRS